MLLSYLQLSIRNVKHIAKTKYFTFNYTFIETVNAKRNGEYLG